MGDVMLWLFVFCCYAFPILHCPPFFTTSFLSLTAIGTPRSILLYSLFFRPFFGRVVCRAVLSLLDVVSLVWLVWVLWYRCDVEGKDWFVRIDSQGVTDSFFLSFRYSLGSVDDLGFSHLSTHSRFSRPSMFITQSLKSIKTFPFFPLVFSVCGILTSTSFFIASSSIQYSSVAITLMVCFPFSPLSPFTLHVHAFCFSPVIPLSLDWFNVHPTLFWHLPHPRMLHTLFFHLSFCTLVMRFSLVNRILTCICIMNRMTFDPCANNNNTRCDGVNSKRMRSCIRRSDFGKKMTGSRRRRTYAELYPEICHWYICYRSTSVDAGLSFSSG